MVLGLSLNCLQPLSNSLHRLTGILLGNKRFIFGLARTRIGAARPRGFKLELKVQRSNKMAVFTQQQRKGTRRLITALTGFSVSFPHSMPTLENYHFFPTVFRGKFQVVLPVLQVKFSVPPLPQRQRLANQQENKWVSLREHQHSHSTTPVPFLYSIPIPFHFPIPSIPVFPFHRSLVNPFHSIAALWKSSKSILNQKRQRLFSN